MDEVERLHKADRLLIQLIKITNLKDRISAMLYNVRFDAAVSLLESVSAVGLIVCCADPAQSTNTLAQACHDLREAKSFQGLLGVSTMSSLGVY